MNVNESRVCGECPLVGIVGGQRVCGLDGIPLGSTFYHYGCVPANFIHTSQYEEMDEEQRQEVQELLFGG